MPPQPANTEASATVDQPSALANFALAAFQAPREFARRIAIDFLEIRGFVRVADPPERWIGTLLLPTSSAPIAVDVRLPERFPDCLPHIFVAAGSIGKRLPHVDDEGKICLAPISNLLLDIDRPEAIVADTIRRAATVLQRGLSGASDEDFQVEFMAYWANEEETALISICASTGDARTILRSVLDRGPGLFFNALLSENKSDAKRWAEAVGATIESSATALLIPLSVTAPIPERGHGISVRIIANLIRHHAAPSGSDLFFRAIELGKYPVLVALSIPEAVAGAGRRLIGARIDRPQSSLLKKAARGFRIGHLPASRIVQMIGENSIARPLIKRADRTFLTARGGGAEPLGASTIAVVGIGAVGSEVARNLASLGVGRLRLVDPERLELENVHRHALGVRVFGLNKALAMKNALSESFPHLTFEHRGEDVERVLTGDDSFLHAATLIIFATGDETLERRLNRALRGGPPRIHTWLEPLGIAGHAFACGIESERTTASGHGCFECLYEPDPDYGLINRSALTAAGTDLGRSLAGCVGMFSPFSALDARRTAIEAAALAARVVEGSVKHSRLVTWRGSNTLFESEGHQLSRRASRIDAGARVEILADELRRSNCTVCSAPGPTSERSSTIRESGQ